MATLIRNRRLAADSWLQPEPGGCVPSDGDVLVPLERWQADRGALLARAGRVGVLLAPSDDPVVLAGDLDRIALVAVSFPQFTDGRGYSIARLLRERYGFRGELRAVGDVLRDQLFYLSRVGFDAFALADGQDADAALAAFDDFSDAYQSSVERPAPLFRRRAA